LNFGHSYLPAEREIWVLIDFWCLEIDDEGLELIKAFQME
jgi:hypothetical protein